jgi:hypothetical protein
MKRILAAFLFAALFVTLCLSAWQSPCYAENQAPAIVDKMLAQSGYSFTKKTSNVWTIDFTGKTLSKFKVILSTGPDLVVMFVTVAKKADFQLTSESMFKLARINHALDRIKAGLDDDGDIFVRIDLSDRILDVKEFKINVEQLAAAADETFKDIQPFMLTPK